MRVDAGNRDGMDETGEDRGVSEIDEQKVREVARLARLGLGDGEAARLAREMSGILGHFDALDRLEGEGEAAGPQGRDLEPRTRADAPGPDPLAYGPEDMAPDWRGGFFVVPRLPALGEEPG